MLNKNIVQVNFELQKKNQKMFVILFNLQTDLRQISLS